ncbi:lytic transglycosylase domain-containing protein [Deferrisoma palaeochoriense]
MGKAVEDRRFWAACLAVALALATGARADVYRAPVDGGAPFFTDAPTEPGCQVVIRTDPPRVPWREAVRRTAPRYGLDPLLVRAVIQVESGENPRAVSPKGAIGLMQLMPDTARELGVLDPYHPRDNVQGGTAYLARLVERYGGRLDLALAAYNAGPGAVDRYGGVPPYPETRRFVDRVLALYRAAKGVDSAGPDVDTTQPNGGRE